MMIKMGANLFNRKFGKIHLIIVPDSAGGLEEEEKDMVEKETVFGSSSVCPRTGNVDKSNG